MERNLPFVGEILKLHDTMKTFPAKLYLAMLLLFAAATVLIPAGCDDDSNSGYYEHYDSRVTSATWNAFRTRHPKAYNVRWYIRGPYAVAYFTDTPGSPVAGTPQNASWFRNDKGTWAMTESEVTFQALPEAVRQAYSAGSYGSWIIDEVLLIERYEAETLYAIEAESGRTELLLCYTASGLEVYALTDDDPQQLIPDALPAPVAAYVAEHYPDAGLLNATVTSPGTQVELVENGTTQLTLRFDPDGTWLSTTTNLDTTQIPQEILQAWEQSDYASGKGFHLAAARFVETSYNGNYYLFDLTSIAGESRIRISEEGSVTPVAQ